MFTFNAQTKNAEPDNLRQWTHQLYREFDGICFQYRLKLLKPSIKIEESRSRWGMWDPVSRTITINRHLIEAHSWDAVIDVLKHEIAHQMVGELYHVQSSSHDQHFRRACFKIAATSWACASEDDMERLFKHHQDRTNNPQEDRLMQKVQKLLALASSSNEHEALLAIQRVKDIYARHHLELLATQKSSGFVYVIVNHRKKRIAQYQSMIASILTSHFFVEVVYSTLYDARCDEQHKTLEILGTPDNVRMAEYVYYYLFNNLPLLWNHHRKKREASSKSKSSYYLGVLTGFHEKLTTTNTQATPTLARQLSELGLDTSLVVTSEEHCRLLKQSELDLQCYVKVRYPRLVSRSYSRGYHDSSTFHAGIQQGREISVHRGITHQAGGKIPLLKG